MKKKYLFGAMLAFGMMAFSSCSDDDKIGEGPEAPELAAGEQVIVLDMQDTDVLSTKSRPLNSTTNQGAEQVTDVKLYVFKKASDSNYDLLKTIFIPDWKGKSTDYNFGRKYTYRLAGDDRLKYGTDGVIDDGDELLFVAVGQDQDSINTLKPAHPFKISEFEPTYDTTKFKWIAADGANASTTGKKWTANSEVGKNFLLTDSVWYQGFLSDQVTSPSQDGDNKLASTRLVPEIFSGVSTPMKVSVDGGFSATVLLKRQVAGVLGYFEKIPGRLPNLFSNTSGDSVSIKYIRLVSSVRNNCVDLAMTLDTQVDDGTYNQDGYQGLEYVVNGFNLNGSGDINKPDAKSGLKDTSVANLYTVYRIDLTKWFPRATNQEGWLWKSEDLWGNDGLLPDSAWVNAIATDVAKDPRLKTGAVMAGEFVIPFKKGAGQTFELQLLDTLQRVQKAWSVKLDAYSINKNEDTELTYNIWRNHLYQIGQRGSGDNPENPGTGNDKPQPLNKDQDLIIKINDQWEFIHDMEIW